MLREDTQHCLATLLCNIAVQHCHETLPHNNAQQKKVLIVDSIQKKSAES